MTNISVPYVAFPEQVAKIKTELMQAVEDVLISGQYVMGEKGELFEKEFATFCNTKHAIGVANGTDALHLVLKCFGVGPGDEVITSPNSFIASAGAIGILGARPVFTDIAEDMNIDPDQLEESISSKTKAIMPVHLTGRPAKMDEILEIANHYKIPVLEDTAQAAGAKYKDKKVGSLGDAAGFSLHPLKNLHAFGDGGVVTTSDSQIFEMLLQSRNHGLINREQCGFWSFNSRLDEMQAAMLLVQLPHLDTWTKERRRLALRYNDLLRPYANVPDEGEGEYCVFQTYVIQVDNRDALLTYLNSNGVQALVHYPLPLHIQPAAKSLGYTEKDFPKTMELSSRILSLPLYPELKEEQQDYVADLFLEFFKKTN
jgi:dTDP-4-amino-4,6-dideoxygalactose transaminase